MTKKSFTIAELAALTQSQVVGSPHHCITAVSDLDSAGEEDASFFAKPEFGQASRYEQALSKSAAGVIFVPPDAPLVEGRNYLLNSDPSRAFQVTLEAFNGTEQKLSGFSGIHATAVIHPTSKIGQQVTIGPYAVIRSRCRNRRQYPYWCTLFHWPAGENRRPVHPPSACHRQRKMCHRQPRHPTTGRRDRLLRLRLYNR